MGRLHARAVARRAEARGDCRLVGVVDRHETRSERVAEEFGAPACHLGEVEADAAIVAVPTAEHARVAEALLTQGVDLLVEKPMTGAAASARALLSAANQQGCVLAVGHTEWWNPVWPRALEASGRPKHMRVFRFHPPTDRGLDIDVVQDFMVHDLDSVRRRVPGDIVSFVAKGRRVANALLDEAEVELVYADGLRVELAVSRVHASKRRRIEIEGRCGRVTGDLVTGKIMEPGGRVRVVAPSDPMLGEPLDRQLADFLGACRDRSRPVNDGEQGVATLELVDRVRAAIERGS